TGPRWSAPRGQSGSFVWPRSRHGNLDSTWMRLLRAAAPTEISHQRWAYRPWMGWAAWAKARTQPTNQSSWKSCLDARRCWPASLQVSENHVLMLSRQPRPRPGPSLTNITKLAYNRCSTTSFRSEISGTPLIAAVPHGAKNVHDYHSGAVLGWENWCDRAAAHPHHCPDLFWPQQAGRFGQGPGRRDQEF